MGERLLPRQRKPKPIGHTWRTLEAPDGTRHRVQVSVFAAPGAADVRLPAAGLDPVILARRRARRVSR